MDPEKFNVEDYAVYARVSPMNKVQIVEAWQKKGKIVAMTGDGVNDAPALKAADIGVGMGITGTEVAKAEADVILMNDSFSTIVAAVREGRRIFDNIRNVLVYLLAANIAEVLVVFLAMVLGMIGILGATSAQEIFTPIQLLYLNLITDSVPAIMLAFEREARDAMRRPTRSRSETFFTPFLITRIMVSSVSKAAVILAIYVWSGSGTVAFFAMVLIEMSFAYSCRDLKKPIWRIGFSNSKLNISMIGLAAVQVVVFFTPVRVVLGLSEMSLLQIVVSLVAAGVVFATSEGLKRIISKIPD